MTHLIIFITLFLATIKNPEPYDHLETIKEESSIIVNFPRNGLFKFTLDVPVATVGIFLNVSNGYNKVHTQEDCDNMSCRMDHPIQVVYLGSRKTSPLR